MKNLVKLQLSRVYISGTQILFLSLLLFGCISFSLPSVASDKKNENIELWFQHEKGIVFTKDEKTLAEDIVGKAERNTRKYFPHLPKKIHFFILEVNKDLSTTGGVAGKIDKINEITLEISNQLPGGVMAAMESGLEAEVYRQVYQIYRQAKFERTGESSEVRSAILNRGLAAVFSEALSKKKFASFQYDKKFSEALYEDIANLPVEVSREEWLKNHSEDVEFIEYKIGKYLIQIALKTTAGDFSKLSGLTESEIFSRIRTQMGG